MQRNPFRSEQDAFRLFVLVAGATIFVVLVALIFGGKVGAYVGLALVLFGLWHMARWIAEAIGAPDEVGKGDDDGRGLGDGREE